MDVISRLNKELDDEKGKKCKKTKAASSATLDGGVRNLYEIMPKDLILECENPHENVHNFKLPARLVVISPSGGGKTNFVCDLISQFSLPPKGSFYKIIIVTRNADEPLYNFLRRKDDRIQVLEGMQNLPPLDKFDKDLPSLVVVDDLVLSKKQDAISNYFIRCRKLNVSCIYISQSFYLCPKIIRQNVNNIIILKLSTEREIKMIMSECSVGLSRDQLLALYQDATSTPMCPLIINMEVLADDPKKFRKGYNHYLSINDYK